MRHNTSLPAFKIMLRLYVIKVATRAPKAPGCRVLAQTALEVVIATAPRNVRVVLTAGVRWSEVPLNPRSKTMMDMYSSKV